MPKLTAKLLLYAITIPSGASRHGLIDVSQYFGVYDGILGNDFTDTMSFKGASAYKGPFYRLLQTNCNVGLDMILQLLNEAAKKYFESQLDNETNEKIVIKIMLNNGKEVQQYCSPRLYFAHREHFSPYAPGVIQTALMALERFLIEIVQQDNFDLKRAEYLVSHIISKSNSVMPIAVLISLANGFPDKFLSSALPFLRVKEFYKLDVKRSYQEQTNTRLNYFGLLCRDPAKSIYQQERQEADNYSWRKQNLLCLVGILQMTSCQQEVVKILDDYKAKLQDTDDATWRRWLHQMDIRNSIIEEDEKNHRLLLIPTEPVGYVESDDIRLAKENLEKYNRVHNILKWGEQTINNDTVILPELFQTVKEVTIELQEFYEIFQKEPIPFYLCQKAITLGCAILLRNYRDELDEVTSGWCWNFIFTTIKQMMVNRFDSNENNTDLTGGYTIIKILPSLFNLNNQEEIDTLRNIIANLIVSENDSVRKYVSIAIRDYIWNFDSEFAEQCLRGAVTFTKIAKDYYKPFPPTEEEKQIFWDKRNTICVEILQGKLLPLSDSITFTYQDTWYLLPIVSMLPYQNRSVIQDKIIDESVLLLLKIQENIHRHQEPMPPMSIDFQNELFSILTDHCFFSDTNFDKISFIDLLFKKVPASLDIFEQILIRLLNIAEKNKQLDRYWRSWDIIAKRFQNQIIDWSTKTSKERYIRNDINKFIATLFYSSYWQEDENHIRELQDHLNSYKNKFVGHIQATISRPAVFEAFMRLSFHFPELFDLVEIDILTANFMEMQPKFDYISSDMIRYHAECIIYRMIQYDALDTISRKNFDAITNILNIMIDKGSQCSFLLRESLFTRKKYIKK